MPFCARSMSSSHVIRSRRSVLGRRWRNGGSDTHGVNAKAAELMSGAQGGRDKGAFSRVTAKRRLARDSARCRASTAGTRLATIERCSGSAGLETDVSLVVRVSS